MGKKITSRISDEYSWFAIGDSHLQKLLQYFSSYGVSTSAISGGGIAHFKSFLQSHNYFENRITGFFLLGGGNDLAANKPATVIVREWSYLIQELEKRNPNCFVITGTVIPRGKGDKFICLAEEVDKQMAKFAINHHHFLCDFFVADPVGRDKLVQPRLDLYMADQTHLTTEGLALYKKALTFVISCANWGILSRE